MIHIRKVAAVLALLSLGGLIVTTVETGLSGPDRFASAMRLLLVPIVLTAIGLIREVAWARWVALGAAVAVLPWSGVLVATPQIAVGAPEVALTASITLLVALSGRSMAERFEGATARSDLSPRRVALLGWTVACNVASILVLYLFVSAYDYRVGWHVAVTGGLMLGLIVSVVALTRGKTAGILGVAVSCLLLVPVGAAFIAEEAAHTGEAMLLVGAFLPGIITAAACVSVFGGPMWKILRG
ncbi:MAG: hypothetical protein OEU54_04735 [Gemmatimonadota bacterium]|nr:hypothetical protein [Gemmatimonadota bacterium]